jgi:quercetin dioxygenase-like cupin family protein
MMNESPGGRDRKFDYHPVIGMQWEFTRATGETSDELFESTNWLDARMPGPPVHVHPNAEESFEVIEGSLDVFKNGEWTTLRPGETAVVRPGVKHTFRNSHDEPAKAVVRIRPAGRSEAFFRDMHRLIREGKAKQFPPKEPRTAIYAAMLYDRYPDFIRATGILKGVFKALAFVGKVLRFDF